MDEKLTSSAMVMIISYVKTVTAATGQTSQKSNHRTIWADVLSLLLTSRVCATTSAVLSTNICKSNAIVMLQCQGIVVEEDGCSGKRSERGRSQDMRRMTCPCGCRSWVRGRYTSILQVAGCGDEEVGRHGHFLRCVPGAHILDGRQLLLDGPLIRVGFGTRMQVNLTDNAGRDACRSVKSG